MEAPPHNGRVTAVTGLSSGIGKAITRQLGPVDILVNKSGMTAYPCLAHGE